MDHYNFFVMIELIVIACIQNWQVTVIWDIIIWLLYYLTGAMDTLIRCSLNPHKPTCHAGNDIIIVITYNEI